MTQSTIAPMAPAPLPQAAPAPLFTIGRLPVRACAPIKAVYDAGNNRNLAASAIWGEAALPERPVF